MCVEPLTINSEMPTFHKCLRCGLCCISGPCNLGMEDEKTGVCKYLKIHQDRTTSCRKVKNDSHPIITIGKGCVIQQWPESYKNFKLFYEGIKDDLMTSSIHTEN